MADGDDREESENSQRDGAADMTDLLEPDSEDILMNEEESDNLEEEYLALDSQLDQLDACLDSLEARNDDLVTKLLALLQDSVQMRQELQELNSQSTGSSGKDKGGHAEDGDAVGSCGSDEKQETAKD